MERNPYSFTCLNIEQSARPSWRLAKVSTDEESTNTKARLFAFAELTRPNDFKIENVKSLIQSIWNSFINLPQTTLTSTTADTLEVLLDSANKKFTAISYNAPQGSFADLSIIVGLLLGDSLAIATHGRLEAWLLHPTATKTGFRFVNILKKGKVVKEKEAKKLFDYVVSGKLADNQPFICLTPNVWQLVSEERLKETITRNSLLELPKAINQMFQSMPNRPDAAFIIAKQEPAQKEMPAALPPTATPQPLAKTFKTTTPQIIGQLTNTAKNVLSSTARATGTIFSISREKGGGISARAFGFIEENFLKIRAWLSSLPLKSRLLIIGSVILTVVFVEFVSIMYQRAQESRVGNEFSESIKSIDAKRDEASARLIFNDRESARELLLEAISEASSLPEGSKKEEDEKTRLLNELNAEMEKTHNLTNVSYLEPFLKEESFLRSQVRDMTLIDDYLVLTKEHPEITFINIKTRAMTNSVIEGVSAISAGTIDYEAKKLYVVDSNGNTFAIALSEAAMSKGEKIIAENLSIAWGENTITNLIFYADRLYALTGSGKIKTAPLATKNVSDWIKDGSIIENAKDIAIDSNVYVLLKENLTRYYRGAKTDWKLKGITPEPKDLKTITASLDDENIYLLDQDKQRLILINKNGELVKQFASTKWDSFKNVAITPDESNAYILSGDSIYLVKL